MTEGTLASLSRARGLYHGPLLDGLVLREPGFEDWLMAERRIVHDRVAQAFARGTDAQRERVLQSYPKVMKDSLGGYYTLGRWFAQMIGNPEVMRLATRYGLPRTTLRYAIERLPPERRAWYLALK